VVFHFKKGKKMKNLFLRLWKEDEGVLTFEWILLTSILVLGLIAAMGTLRDALVNELADLAGAAHSINQTYTVRNPNYLNCSRHFAAGSAFTDTTKLPADPTPAANP
jgi:Flp pilus assembly pilin Flp